MEKYCSNCGKEIKEGATVCLNCGKLLNRKVEKKGVDKSFIIAIVVGIVGVFLISLFWLFVSVVAELDEGKSSGTGSRRYCCIEAGGSWSDGRCRTGYWFDEDDYYDCLDSSF